MDFPRALEPDLTSKDMTEDLLHSFPSSLSFSPPLVLSFPVLLHLHLLLRSQGRLLLLSLQFEDLLEMVQLQVMSLLQVALLHLLQAQHGTPTLLQ